MNQPTSDQDKWRLLLERIYARLEDHGVDMRDIERLRAKGKKLLEGHE